MRGFINKLFEDRKVRFLFVGVLNTIVGYGSYALLIYLEMHYLLAQLLAGIISITHSYLWNKYFTFRRPDRSASEIIRFVSVYVISYLLSTVILYISIEFLKWNAYISGAICLFVITIISYVGHKSISFRRATD